MRLGISITRIDRYLFRQLMLALVAVTLGLTAFVWLTQSLRFVQLVVDHGLSLGVFLELTGLLVPSFVAVILPITTYVVIQFVYQRLAGDRELMVMRAAGLSSFTLARPALTVAMLATIACYILNLWVVPTSFAHFRTFQWEIRNRVAAFLLQEGVFTPVSDKLTVYVRSREPNGTLHGILIDDSRDPNAHATILAESGRLISGANGPQVLLENGSRQELDRRTGRLDVLTFKENTLDLSDVNKDTAVRPPEMNEQSLYSLLHTKTPNPADTPKWRAEAHKRLAGPLACLSYALVALVAVLSGQFQRHGNLLRPLASVGIVVGLLASGLAAGNLAARSNALIWVIWVQAVLPGLVAAWMLFGPELRAPALRRTRVPA